MKRLERFLTFWAILPWSRGPAGNGVLSLGEGVLVSSTRCGPINHLTRLRWIGLFLGVLFVVLAPWGGPCERWSRPADPTTTRVVMSREQASESQPGLHGPGDGAGLAGLYLDIMDDEDEDEELESRNVAAHSQEFAQQQPRALGPLDADHCRDDPGRLSRSPTRRC
jgi:hypothetical protein